MATASVVSAMSAEGGRAIHPFFARPKGDDNTKPNAVIPDGQVVTDTAHGEDSDYEEKPSKPNGRRKKTKNAQPPAKQKNQKTLGEVISQESLRPSQPGEENACRSEADIQDARRKRRRTSQTESVEVGSDDPRTPPYVSDIEGRSSPQVIISASSPLPHQSGPVLPSDGLLAYETPPKKLLKLNANGKFSSPPTKPKAVESDEQATVRPSRRSRSGAAKPSHERGLLVKISYSNDDTTRARTGDQITRILSGEQRIVVNAKRAAPKKRTPQKPKATHPFFVGKKEPPAPTKHDSPRKASAATPGKLRMQTLYDRSDHSKDSSTFVSALLRDRLMIKHPGAKDAPFPSRENTHVRGTDKYWVKQPMSNDTFKRLYHDKKRKQAQVSVLEANSVLSRFASHLTAEDDKKLRPDGFYEPSADLSVPERLLLSGKEIAQIVDKQLSTPLGDNMADELSLTSSQIAVHPAVRRLYERIPKIMTAFDESRGEALSWTHKYAPASADEILQPEKEILVLKQWLQSLAVQSVGGAATAPAKSTSSKDKPKRKRKKKPDDLDDFLMDSDEEIREMSEIINDDDDSTNTARASRTMTSVVQSINDSTKLSNVVLLSGPHGCGKSAAALAVAKEMNYKIFEISSSERRSGRDVLDKVGDMTENHLVKHRGTGTESAEVSSAEEPGRHEEAFQKDLQSGRQGKMSAFFKPQVKAEAKPKERKKALKEKTIKSVQEALQKPPNDQQQSLILLEEIDILFKDDKEFWTIVLKLVTTSKRPFIMTCNDEDLVPTHLIQPHAFLRFTQPAAKLATDYMLLIAAAEGHLLPRSAVSALYDRHGHDLRASITELDFWCQMGVGDPREGLSWIYQRWPPGSDLDEQGRKLRVVSRGTYQEGMGLGSKSTHIEETLTQVWDEHGIEPVVALGWTPSVEDEIHETGDSLKQMSRQADAFSDADLCLLLAEPGAASLDPAQPELSDKARSNYIEGMRVLQTDERVEYSSLGKELVVSMTLLARQTSSLSVWTPSTKKEIVAKEQRWDDSLSRHAFSCFDTISAPAEVSLSNLGLVQSAFDGPRDIIALDLAPYVRSIVRHDQALEEQRERLNLLTSDGRKAKRARTTRAARSALEGGQRATTRRERWFTNDLNFDAVLATGGEDWPRIYESPEAMEGASRISTDATASPAEEGIQYEE